VSQAHTKFLGTILCVPALLAGALVARGQPVGHVVVFGVDGLSARGVEKGRVPVMRGLMENGLWTLRARAVFPTVSSPNWAAMIMGAAPDVTGVTSNEWQPDKREIIPYCDDGGGHPPTIFGLISKARQDAKTALFTDWPDFARLIEPSAASKVFAKDGDASEVVEEAIRYLVIERPTLTFIHVDHVDHAGHTVGWDTPEYFQAVEKADELLGLVLKALDESGLSRETVVLVTADHGGHQKKHGAMIQQDIEIPWIAAGPGLPKNRMISYPVSTTQTAPTVAQWLGLTAPDCWLARPVAPGAVY
jgi:predicted AlkP superfamily pyrophosphatase or phosphodiesterase